MLTAVSAVNVPGRLGGAIEWDVCGEEGWPDRVIGHDRVGAAVADHARSAVGAGGGTGHDRPGARARSSAQQPPEHLLIGAVCRTSAASPRARSGPRLRRRGAPQPSLRRGDVGHSSCFQWRRPRDRDRQGRPAGAARASRSTGSASSIPATSAASRGSRSPRRPARCLRSPRTSPTAQLERALDEALIKRLITHAAIVAVVARLPEPPRRRPPQSPSRPRPPHHRDPLGRRRGAARADPQGKPPRPRSQRQSRQLHRRLPLARTEGDRRARRLRLPPRPRRVRARPPARRRAPAHGLPRDPRHRRTARP